MKSSLIFSALVGLLAGVASAATSTTGAGAGTTTIVINGQPHVYDSDVSGVGADSARLSKYKALNSAPSSTDAQVSAQYGMGASASGTATSMGNSIGQAWNKGTAPSTAGLSQDTQAIAARYYGSSANKTPLEKGSVSPSSTTMQSYTQGLIGVAGVEGTAGPIDRNSGAGAATFKSSSENTIPCGTNKDFSVNGWTGKLTCNGTTSVTVLLCPHPPGTVYCSSDDELKSFTLGSGVQSQDAGLGLTMLASFPDSTSVKLKFSTKMSVSAVTQTAAQRADANSSGGGAGGTGTANANSTLGMLSKVTNSTNYAKALQGPGASVATCQEKAENGESCDGDVVDVSWVKADGALPAGCDTDICLTQSTTKTDWTESCTRSFTRTNYACSYVRAPLSCTTIAKTAPVTYTCEFANCGTVTAAEVEDYFGGVSSCVHDSANDSCYTVGFGKRCDQRWICAAGTVARTCDGGVDPKTKPGYVQVGTTSKVVTVNGGTQNQLIESWLGPEVATNNCTATPYPLAGTVSASCENQGAGKVRGMCEAWYGRTLTSSACSATSAAGLPLDVSEAQKQGCGYCIKYSMLDSCSALAPSSDSDCPAARKSECVLGTTSCTSASPQGTTAQCYAQQETYNCSKSTTNCTAWGKPDSCKPSTGGITAGIPSNPRQVTPSTGLSQAIIGLALMDATAKSANNCVANQNGCSTPDDASKSVVASDKRTELAAEATKDDTTWYSSHGGLPLIFNGNANECLRSSLLGANCCDINLDRSTTQCSAADVQLALARRNKFTHYVGEYCKESRNGTCVSVAEQYCSFEGLLQRVVQEQGRKQIDQTQAAYQGADTTSFSSTLSYYGTGDKGSWAWHQTKDSLQVYQWAWPTWCRDPAAAQAKLSADATAPDCPAVPEIWFATCIESTDPGAPSRCGTPPSSPFENKPGFDLVRVDPLAETITPIHRQAWVKGACDSATSECAYQVNVTTSGNHIILSREISFTSTTGAPAGSGTASFQTGPISVIGNTILRPIEWAMEGAGPSDVTIQFSTDGGTNWSAVKVPAVNPAGTPTRLPGAEGVDVVVSCDSGAGAASPMPCVLKSSGTIVMTSKPWSVGVGQMDCSGFTGGQFSMLDYDRMDLSEWTSATSTNLSVDTSQLPSVLGAQVKTMTDKYYASGTSDTVTLGSATAVSPERAQSLYVSPDTGFGPFAVQLMVSGNWPQLYDDPARNTNPVRAVQVDWGDSSGMQAADPQSSNGVVSRFTAQHTYQAPTSQANQVQMITVTITAADGAHTMTKAIQNNWQTASNVLQARGTTQVPGQVLDNSANQTTVTVPGAGVLKSLSGGQ